MIISKKKIIHFPRWRCITGTSHPLTLELFSVPNHCWNMAPENFVNILLFLPRNKGHSIFSSTKTSCFIHILIQKLTCLSVPNNNSSQLYNYCTTISKLHWVPSPRLPWLSISRTQWTKFMEPTPTVGTRHGLVQSDWVGIIELNEIKFYKSLLLQFCQHL